MRQYFFDHDSVQNLFPPRIPWAVRCLTQESLDPSSRSALESFPFRLSGHPSIYDPSNSCPVFDGSMHISKEIVRTHSLLWWSTDDPSTCPGTIRLPSIHQEISWIVKAYDSTNDVNEIPLCSDQQPSVCQGETIATLFKGICPFYLYSAESCRIRSTFRNSTNFFLRLISNPCFVRRRTYRRFRCNCGRF